MVQRGSTAFLVVAQAADGRFRNINGDCLARTFDCGAPAGASTDAQPSHFPIKLYRPSRYLAELPTILAKQRSFYLHCRLRQSHRNLNIFFGRHISHVRVMAKVVRQSLWNAEVAQSGHGDKIIVSNLEVVVNAGKDVWGRQKKQRACISVTLTLGEQFTSASSTDSVDDSTVHYGTLSKAIQAQLQDDASTWMPTSALSSSIFQAVRKVAGSANVYAIETDVCYLKGSMFGDGISHITSTIRDSKLRSNVLYLRNIRIPCVIGVNSNERLQKQPVVLNLWVDGVSDSRVDDYAELETLLFSVS